MRISSPIYGKFDITEPVLIELLKSPAVLRLKKISQYGVPDKYYEFPGYSRYIHSIGVMLLLRKLDASIEEQAAGLLHDVSHFAFSHVADWVFADGNKGREDYHDSLHKRFVLETEIPQILAKHGLNIERILDESNFTLLENDLPDVCADRFDYSIQEIYLYFDKKTVPLYLAAIKNYDGKIVFTEKEPALAFAKDFLRLNVGHWGADNPITRYYDFSEILKECLKKQIIDKRDFNGTEEILLKKIESSSDPDISQRLKLLAKRSYCQVRQKRGVRIQKKFRYVDPAVLIDGKLIKVTEIYPDFKEKLDFEREKNSKGIIV